MAKRKTKRTCECGAEIKEPRVRKCARCRAKPALRILPDGRRIDLKAKREKRKTLKAQRKVQEPVKVDPVAEAEGRKERRLRATVREQDVMQGIKGPRKAAEKQVRTRAQTGKESATPERMVMAGDDLDEDALGRQRAPVAPLDSLRKRKVNGQPILTSDQFEAGDRYRDDCCTAGVIKSHVASLETIGSGYGARMPGFLASEAKASAMDRVNAADQALGHGLKEVVHAVVFADVQDNVKEIGMRLFGRRDGNQAGAALVEVLKIGLNRLAAHYAGKQVDDLGNVIERRRRMGSSGERAVIDETQWRKNGTE